MLLQSATACVIRKCNGLLLQSATAFLLLSATIVITKLDRYYKVRQFYYKVRYVLQSATEQGVGWVGAAISPAVQNSREKTDSAMRHGKDTSFTRYHGRAISS